MKQADELHERLLSFDSHITVPMDFGTAGNEADKDGSGQFDLVKTGRVTPVRCGPDNFRLAGNLERSQRAASPHRRLRRRSSLPSRKPATRSSAPWCATSPTRSPSPTPRTISGACTGEGKFAIFMSMLNAYPLGNDLNALDQGGRRRGMRMFGFRYVGNNAWADSSRPLPFFNDSRDALGGLSDIGKQAVQRLNDLGVIIDVSQMSTKALEQVAQLSRTPMVASHSAPRALVDIPRNLSDQRNAVDQGQRRRGADRRLPTYIRPLSQCHPGQAQRPACAFRPATPARPGDGVDAGRSDHHRVVGTTVRRIRQPALRHRRRRTQAPPSRTTATRLTTR